MQNNAAEEQWDREGTYILHWSKVNEQPSWISEFSGIWYVPNVRGWMIGALEFKGLDQGGIESKDLGSKFEYPENIVDWNYYTTENGWIKGNDDVIIGCIEDNKKKGKSVPLICYELANFNKC